MAYRCNLGLSESEETTMSTYDPSSVEDTRKLHEKLPCEGGTAKCPYRFMCHSAICRVHAFVRWIGDYAPIGEKSPGKS